MKILTPRNNKDYYDFLTGIYGMDEKIVFDRRKFTILSRLDHPLFSSKLLDKDVPKKEKPSWQWKNRRIPEYEGTKYECLLEVGLKWFFCEVERYLEDGKVCLDWKLVKEKEITKRQRVGSVFCGIDMQCCFEPDVSGATGVWRSALRGALQKDPEVSDNRI